MDVCSRSGQQDRDLESVEKQRNTIHDGNPRRVLFSRADQRFEQAARLHDEIKRLQQTELAVLDDPTAKRPGASPRGKASSSSPAQGGSPARAARGGGKGRGDNTNRPHKPLLDEMGIGNWHEAAPSRADSPRSKLGKPGQRGGFKGNRKR